MIIDIILLVLLALAVWKGYSRGLIVGLFSFLAIIIGLAAAMKLSVIAAGWLETNTQIGRQWIPFLSFLLVMVAVMLLVRFAASVIEKAVQIAMLGWLNRLGGILLYAVLYIAVYSVAIFYLQQMEIFKPDTVAASVTYPYIAPIGPKTIGLLSTIIPWFKDMFSELSTFFGSVAGNA